MQYYQFTWSVMYVSYGPVYTDFRCDFLLLNDVKELISYECSKLWNLITLRSLYIWSRNLGCSKWSQKKQRWRKLKKWLDVSCRRNFKKSCMVLKRNQDIFCAYKFNISETMKFMAKISKNGSINDNTKIYKTAQETGTDVQQLLQFPPSLIFLQFLIGCCLCNVLKLYSWLNIA